MDILTQQAFGFLDAGMTDRAEEMFSQTLASDSANMMARLGRGIARSRRANHAGAVLDLELIPQDNPLYPDARIALSEVLARQGNHAAEAEALAAAMMLQPAPGLPLKLKYASALRRARQFGEAETVIAELQEIFPADVRLLYEHGMLALDQEDYQLAADRFSSLVNVKPDLTEGWISLSIAAKNCFKNQLSIEAGLRAVDLEPDLALAHVALGNAFRAADRRPEALETFVRAVALAPQNAEAHMGHGLLLMETGQIPQAVTALSRASELSPRQSQILNNLSVALRYDRQFERAIDVARRAVDLVPASADSHNNLANALRDAGRLYEAETAYRRSLSLRPNHAPVMGNLANLLRDLVEPDAALEMNRAAVAVNAEDEVVGTKLLFGLCQHPDINPVELFREHQVWADRFAPEPDQIEFETGNDPDRVIRVGLVSPDFRAHSLRYFMEGLFHVQPRERFHLTAFAEVARPDAETDRIRGLTDGWVNTSGLSKRGFSGAVRDAQIDILIDLAGHTAKNRLSSFGERLAPVQVEWGGGYAFTTGLPQMDAILVDATVAPPEDQPLYSERLIVLPTCFTSYQPPANAADVSPLPALNNDYVTFGSISRTSKLNLPVIRTWAEIIGRVPGSHLILMDRNLGDQRLQDKVWSLFETEGISRDRIDLRGPGSHERAMATYHEIDVALDPFPNSGGITLCEAMWHGVPVVALRGNFFLARVGASLISGAGFPQWVSDHPGGYVETAVRLASDREALADIRKDLRHSMSHSVLCDVDAYGAGFGAALLELWSEYCAR